MIRRIMPALAGLLLAMPAAAQDAPAPSIPEPMVFDLVRPLGAKRGELEANVLLQRNLSGPERSVEWAPEIEYAVADGFAVELELPFENGRVVEYKLGVQGTFGTLNRGRGIHGVQYLGLYNRQHGRWENSLLYVLGNRFSDRLSTLSMVGIGDVTTSGPSHPVLLLNHTTFYDLGRHSLAGVEVNYRSGADRSLLVMPQLHKQVADGIDLQIGVGGVKARDEVWRPRFGIRLIRQFGN
ncbi:MAG: hypothetical protein ABW182_06375 [Sphingomonas sp.]